MNKVCIFTQTYSDDRKILFEYHNLDTQDIIFRNNFHNVYVFHNSSESYFNDIINYQYFKNIKDIEYVKYSNITYTESFKQTLKYIYDCGYEYLIFLQDDVFSNENKNIDKLVKFIKNENFSMLNLETVLDRFRMVNSITFNIKNKRYYTDNDFVIYDTDSLDFRKSVSPRKRFYPEIDDTIYWPYDDGPYVANIKYLIDNIYDEHFYSIGNIQLAENYLANKVLLNPIQRLTTNKIFYRRYNIVGPSSERNTLGYSREEDLEELNDMLKK